MQNAHINNTFRDTHSTPTTHIETHTAYTYNPILTHSTHTETHTQNIHSTQT